MTARCTYIYWMCENGVPFYAGKTVHSPESRLKGHIKTAKRHPRRLISKRIRRALSRGGQLSMRVVQVVPAGADWQSAERHWIAELRKLFDCANSSDGGSGYQHTMLTRAKLRSIMAAKNGRSVSVENALRAIEDQEIKSNQRQQDADRQQKEAIERRKCRYCDPVILMFPKRKKCRSYYEL